MRGDHFALLCNVQADGANWTGSTVSCQVRTGTNQLLTNASNAGYVVNSVNGTTISIAVSIPNTETKFWPDTVYTDLEISNDTNGIKPFTAAQWKVTVYDDSTK